ncbi:MAG: hypothetical protein ACI8Q9_002636 [Planctomycetota bacterium]|jgi:hypothetical protein
MKIQTACALLAFAPLLGLTTSLAPTNTPALQDGAAATTPGATAELPQVHFYSAKHVNTFELAEVAENLFGRVVNKYDDLGRVSGGTNNVQLLGIDRLVIFDTDERAQAILDLCRLIDVIEDDLAEFEQQVDMHPVLKSVEYAPRYLSSNDLMDALRPFHRPIQAVSHNPGAVTSMFSGGMNIDVLGDSGSLMIRDTEEAIAEITDLLKTLDQPSPQVQLVCYVLRGSKGEEADGDSERRSNGGVKSQTTVNGADDWGRVSPGIPSQITDNLKRLVPYSSFELASMGVLRMSTSASSLSNSLRMPGNGEVFEMSLRVSAFDEKEGVLSFNDFDMNKQEPMGQTNLFSTATSVQAGEYAVMGASGADPVFVVLHFEVIGK